jgi:hypothetical protein
MALPASNVEICNIALDYLKEKVVTDIDAPTTVVESLLSRRYDLTRTSLLASRNWNFARAAKAFLLTTTPDVSIYSDAYALPNDYIRLLALLDPRHPLSRYDYEISQGLLLIDNDGAESIDAWYTKNITDISLMPAYFIDYLAAELAFKVSFKITAKNAAIKEMKLIRDDTKMVALAANGQERPPIRYESSKLVNAGLRPTSQQQVAGPHTFLFDPN